MGKISHNNSRGKKDIVVVVRKFLGRRRDGPRIRAQFIRKGETIIMDNIPNGTYFIQTYDGDSWIKNLNPKNRFLRSSSFTDYKSFPFSIYNNTMRYMYNMPDGDQGDSINKDDFFN